jgi:Type III restriction enzyme, res subunit/Phage-integrase repeat unit
LSLKFLPFEEARAYVWTLKLNNVTEWREYNRSGKKPHDIPFNPERTYKNEWKGYGDWLGTGTLATKDIEFMPFEEARRIARSLQFKNNERYKEYCRTENRHLPAVPNLVYKKKWKGWGDFLGTGNITRINREFWPFPKARKFVHLLGLRNRREYLQWCKSGKKPEGIPIAPHKVYDKQKQWKGWEDFLGTGFLPFEEARRIARSLGLKSEDEWSNYCRTGQKPDNIPTAPHAVYEKEWVGYDDFLGYEGLLTLRKVKELLRDLIKSKVIYQWNEAVLYSFLLRKGLLNLQSRHTQFFKNLIEASRTTEGRKVIEEYANSDSEIPPELSKYKEIGQDMQQEEIQSASSQELSDLVQNTDPLDYGKIKTAEQILAQTNVLESINVDEEAMQFYIDYSIDELWKSAFRDKENTVLAVKNEGKNGNKYHDIVAESFLTDYEGTQNIKTPKGYSFPYYPTLMQLYVAYKVKTNQYFGNFSGTGAGKTLSAVLASRVVDSKMTLIICPNDVVDQWTRSIIEIFPDSNVITGKEAFYQNYDENKYQYLVLNYDKFSQEESPNLILNLTKGKVDFVVLDEIHFVKKRDEESSQRRKNLDGLVTAVRKKNNNVKVLGLSATPVVNNLMEGRSLLGEGFETYIDEERGDFTFIEAREL